MTSRWDALSSALTAFHQRIREDSFIAGTLANQIGATFADYIEIPHPSRLKFYSYAPGPSAEFDKYVEAGNGVAAVSQTRDNRWQFAIGVITQQSPPVPPEFQFYWPIHITVGHMIYAEDLITERKVEIPKAEGGYNVEPFCAQMYEGIMNSFTRSASPQSSARYGFFSY